MVALSRRKAIAFLLFASTASAPAWAQTQEEVRAYTNHVKQVLASMVPQRQRVVTGLQGQFWKEAYSLDERSVKFDVRRTESLVNPVQATLAMEIDVTTSEHRNTAEAAAAEPLRRDWSRYVFEAVYVPTQAGWKLLVGKSRSLRYPALADRVEETLPRDLQGPLRDIRLNYVVHGWFETN
jgi:hypothetical protein